MALIVNCSFSSLTHTYTLADLILPRLWLPWGSESPTLPTVAREALMVFAGETASQRPSPRILECAHATDELLQVP